MELQTRIKWKIYKNDIVLNSIDLVKDQSTVYEHSITTWKDPEIVPKNERVFRVTDIYISAGVIQRTFSKICPLPQETTDNKTTFTINAGCWNLVLPRPVMFNKTTILWCIAGLIIFLAFKIIHYLTLSDTYIIKILYIFYSYCNIL